MTTTSRVLLARLALAVVIVATILGCEQIRKMTDPTPESISRAARTLRNGERDRAVVQFDAALQQNAQNPDVYGAIMIECVLAGHRDLAEAYFRKGEAAIPTTKPAERATLYLHASGVYDKIGDPAASIAAADQAWKLQPEDWRTLNGLGYAYAQAGENPPKAVALTSKALEKMREEGRPEKEIGMAAMDSLGWAYLRNNEIDKAVDTLAHAADLAPEIPEIHLHLARAYLAKDRVEDARIEVQRGLAIMPEGGVKRELEDVNRTIAARKPRSSPIPPAEPPTSARREKSLP